MLSMQSTCWFWVGEWVSGWAFSCVGGCGWVGVGVGVGVCLGFSTLAVYRTPLVTQSLTRSSQRASLAKLAEDLSTAHKMGGSPLFEGARLVVGLKGHQKEN